MEPQKTECTAGPRVCNNYFDGLEVTGLHKLVFFIIMLAYFFEQMDNWNFGFIAAEIFKTWGYDKTQSTAAMARILFWYFTGMTAGGLLGGVISDIIGRRKTFLCSILLFSTGSMINAFPSHSELLFIVARTLTGFGVFCLMVCSQAYIAEMAPSESRGKWQALVAAVGFCAVPFVAFLCRVIVPLGPNAWRWIFVFGGLGYLGFFVALKWLRESPRWLVAQGRQAEAEAIVKEITNRDIDLTEVAKCCPPRESALECLYGMFEKQYIGRTLLLIACFVFTVPPNFVYTSWTAKVLTALTDASGAPLYSSEVKLTIMTIISCGVPAGCYFASFIADKGGRKWPMLFCFLGSAAMTYLFSQVATHMIAVAAAGFFCSVFNLAGSFMLFSYTAESYPTRIRNTAAGVHNGIARFSVSGAQLLVPLVLSTFGGMVNGVNMDVPALFTVCAICFVIPLPFLAIFGKRTSGKSLEEIS